MFVSKSGIKEVHNLCTAAQVKQSLAKPIFSEETRDLVGANKTQKHGGTDNMHEQVGTNETHDA